MNRDEYDAALKRGIRLGLEAAYKAVDSNWKGLAAEWRSIPGRNAYLEGQIEGMGDAADTIRLLDPDTIAAESGV